MQAPEATVYAAVIAFVGVMLGTLMSSIVGLIVARHNTSQAERLKAIELAEEQRLRVENYVVERLRLIEVLSRPIEHRAALRDRIVGEHLRLVGESLYSRALLNRWGKDAAAGWVDELEELFHTVWQRRWVDTDTGQDFGEYRTKVHSLSSSILDSLHTRPQIKKPSVSK